MTTRYAAMVHAPVEGAASFASFSDSSLNWELSIGRPMTSVWPTGMAIPMDPEWPDDIALIDAPSNQESVLLASPSLRGVLEAEGLPGLEFLSIDLVDHKGRIAAADYCVVNCCNVVDCVDQEKSSFKWDGLDEPSMVVREAVLDESRLQASDLFFRPRYVPGIYIFREDLAQRILDKGIRGLAFSGEFLGDFDYFLG